MVFGRRGTKRRLEADQSEQTQQSSNEVDVKDQQNPIEVDVEDQQNPIEDQQNQQNNQKSCNHCQKTHTSSYTRIHHHFFGAPASQKSDIAWCTTMLTNRSELERIKAMVEGAESNGGSQSLTKSTIANSNVRKSRTQRNVIAESFCTKSSFINMIAGLSRGPTDYKSPSFDRARTTLVDEVYHEVDNELAAVKSTWGTVGTSIVSDGSIFMYADDFSGKEKTGKDIANYLLEAIDEIGPSNVLQVVTDNASNCKAVGREIEKVHKHIFWAPYVVHTVNLMFNEFDSSFEWISETYKKGKEIVKYFKNHQNAQHMFRTHSDLELLKVAKTRFGSHFLLLERLSRCRGALAITVVQMGLKDWIKMGDEALGRRVAANINDRHKMGEVYEKMDCMIGEIKDLMSDNKHLLDWKKMEEILVSRWEKMNIPLHCLGFALNPQYYDANYLKTVAPGGHPRRAPNADRVVNGVLKAFDKIGEDKNEKTVLCQQLSAFQAKKGIFGSREAMVDAVIMNPISWWSTYGSETPELAEIAVRVLAQPISSSSAERVCSTYSYIHNTKRNRLNGARVDKLVFIHSNIRLISRLTASYKEGLSKKWDINPESDYLEDSIIRLEELRCV
ncbi:hypothetical protein RND81_08G111000 [Saponaria officinalis]|uniref:DUF659 domain-containing protein n=1 Tax=Saponaria officinalis TaxID=3572 RepID=A0AAW1J9I5_SAPOF